MRRQKRYPVVLVIAFLGGVVLAASPARAADETRCVAYGELTFSPGLSTTPSSGSFTTDGYTGTTTCDGPINGYQPTANGIRGEDGRYGISRPATCDSGTDGDYKITFRIPTTGGEQQVVDTGTFSAGGLEHGFVTVKFEGNRMHGTVQLVPTEGNCVTSPIVRVRFRCEEFVRDVPTKQ
jgi:hypothetical protein